MSAWDVLAKAASVESFVGMAVGSVVANVYNTHVSTSESILELCKKALEEIKSRLNELTPRQRDEIYVLAKQKKCKSLENIELDLRELSTDRCELSQRSAQAWFWERRVPLSQLRSDIETLRGAVEALLHDTWNTTTSPSKEARTLAQAQLKQALAEHQPSTPPAGLEAYELQGVHVVPR